MTPDTGFQLQTPAYAEWVCREFLAPGLLSDCEILEIRAQCEGDRALCLTCDDGMIVVELRPHGESLELFVWVAIAFRHGAFERQHAAVLQMARDLDARTIAFHARRRGWARRLGAEWFPRGNNDFERLTNGR